MLRLRGLPFGAVESDVEAFFEHKTVATFICRKGGMECFCYIYILFVFFFAALDANVVDSPELFFVTLDFFPSLTHSLLTLLSLSK